MALSRIRNWNPDFRDAQLSRARILIMGGSRRPLSGGQGILSRLAQLHQNNSDQRPEPPEILSLLLGILGTPEVSGDRVSDHGLQAIIQQLMENDPNRYGPPPASKEAITKLKQVRLGDFAESAAECCVCLSKFSDSLGEEAEQKVLEMPCGHLFHSECLLPWLEQHNSCPNCRLALAEQAN
jgi:hypothetical protein